jgi:multidrug efflux pump subunit AcrB
MKLLHFIISHSRIFTLLVIFLPIVAGVFAYQSLPKEGEPEISAPHAIVVTPYTGASPAEIESLVTNPLEEALSDLKNVEEMRSSSYEGASVIVIDFDVEADIERSLQKVRENVTDARKDLPDEAEDPEVSEINFTDIPIMLVSIVGDMDPLQLKKLAEDAADEIELLPEVLSTDVAGGKTREIQIYIDPERLNQCGLTILDVYNAVKQSDINIPGGMVNVTGRRMLLRTMTEIKRVEDYAVVPLLRKGDRIVFLGDVGIVKDGFQEDLTYSRVDGMNSVSIAVKKRAGANILKTSENVRQKIQELEKDFPAGIKTVITADQAKFIRQGFDVMNNSAVFGLIVVIFVLYFAMGLRNSVITSLSIPLSLLVTFMLLKVFGITNNNMVRFSLVLCIGLLVDNAIIVVENVYHHYQLGKERLQAVIDGVSEIAMPVISATMTTMAAFLPMLLMTGVTGEYMGFLPKTVSIALTASLIVALIANPLVLVRFMKQTKKAGRVVRPEEDLRRLKQYYVRGVSWALNHRVILVLITILSLLVAVNLIDPENKMGIKMVDIEMFPDIDFDYIYITVETPPGTEVDRTDAIVRRIEKIVDDNVPEKVQVVSTIGYKGQSAYEFSLGSGAVSHFAEITVELMDGHEYDRARHIDVQKRIKPMLDEIPGAAIRFRALQWGPPQFAPIVVKVIGHEIEILRSITNRVKNVMDGVIGVVDIKDDFSDAPPELRVEVDRALAASMGVPLQSVAMVLRGATAGLEIREFRDEVDVSRKYDLKVRFSPQSRTTPRMLEKVKVRSDSGALVPLSNFAKFRQGAGINEIRHVDRRRVVRISARNEGRTAVEISRELIVLLKALELPPGYEFDFSGDYQETQESFASLKLAYIVAFTLIFTLLVSQFNSFFQPFAIMTALPLSVIGAVIGLIVTNNNFSIMSFVGLVGLSGIVVNDSIVLVDCINRMRAKGMSIFNGILAAGQQRLRPIISTTVSTIGGILTLTITDELWEGLGVVIIFGIAFATVLTLVVVPVMYSIFEEFGYFAVSAIRGPRWKEAPKGKGFFFSRRRQVYLWIGFFVVLQGLVLVKALPVLMPMATTYYQSTVFQAPTILKLIIEITVFFLGFFFWVMGIGLLLFIPTWLGFLTVMGRRSKEGYYVDVAPGGLKITSVSEQIDIPASEIDRIKNGWFGKLYIYSGRRRIGLKHLLPGEGVPKKIPIRQWLARPAPKMAELKAGMERLKRELYRISGH